MLPRAFRWLVYGITSINNLTHLGSITNTGFTRRAHIVLHLPSLQYGHGGLYSFWIQHENTKFQWHNRAEGVVIKRLKISHTKATKSSSIYCSQEPCVLPPLYSNTDHWPHAQIVCSVIGLWWWILYSFVYSIASLILFIIASLYGEVVIINTSKTTQGRYYP